MRIFVEKGKFNAVDSNNNFVGYDLHSNCCEEFGWFISDMEREDIYGNNYKYNLEDYNFDINYCEKIGGESEDYQELHMVRFKMVNKDYSLYLHLYNHHNGYYSHGVEAKMGEAVIEDSL